MFFFFIGIPFVVFLFVCVCVFEERLTTMSSDDDSDFALGADSESDYVSVIHTQLFFTPVQHFWNPPFP